MKSKLKSRNHTRNHEITKNHCDFKSGTRFSEVSDPSRQAVWCRPPLRFLEIKGGRARNTTLQTHHPSILCQQWKVCRNDTMHLIKSREKYTQYEYVCECACLYNYCSCSSYSVPTSPPKYL